ncbi:MAG: ribosomal-protein-alanine N-acetyltransferase [Burkholderiales bacterium RIFCSPLOWO2_02_FULL_57_36]|nr:MAG: ribosomal-protein-alanine N-acetyltransferase [Burkholderiales bacterium RIFCSPLOWO2_02_FULL_57_36]
MSSVSKSISSELDFQSMQFAPMQATDLAEVLAIENAAYPFPWTKGNFLDSMNSGYETWILRDASRNLLGYFLMMPVVDEAHLLNITVHADLHGQGIGRVMLDQVVKFARGKGLASVLLEVRPSNQRALVIYSRYGFQRIGVRKNYYPAALHTREDAIVMRLPI